MDYLTPDFVPGANPRSSGAQSRRQSQSVPRLQVGGQDRRPSVLQQRPGVRDDRRSSSIALRGRYESSVAQKVRYSLGFLSKHKNVNI